MKQCLTATCECQRAPCRPLLVPCPAWHTLTPHKPTSFQPQEGCSTAPTTLQRKLNTITITWRLNWQSWFYMKFGKMRHRETTCEQAYGNCIRGGRCDGCLPDPQGNWKGHTGTCRQHRKRQGQGAASKHVFWPPLPWAQTACVSLGRLLSPLKTLNLDIPSLASFKHLPIIACNFYPRKPDIPSAFTLHVASASHSLDILRGFTSTSAAQGTLRGI